MPDVTVPYGVPYICQFASPTLVKAFIDGERALESDPEWVAYGADSPEEYAHWAKRSCGVVCIKMAVDGLCGIDSGPVMAWVRAGLAVDGYLAEQRAERRVEIGWKHDALAQLAFIHFNDEKATVHKQYRLGHVILVGSDYDRHLFGAYLNEGLMKVPKTVSIYLSGKDMALGVSSWLFGRDRLGQKWTDSMDPQLAKYLRNTPALRFIDVTDAAGATTDNGHAYFRKSPWASSDILMTLMFDLEPNERGLVQNSETLIWSFPADYIQRLRNALLTIRPDDSQAPSYK